MKQILSLLVCLVFILQGCALIPPQLNLAHKDKTAHKHPTGKAQKSLSQHKVDKKHRLLKEKVQLVDFKLFEKDQHKQKKHHKKHATPEVTGKVMTVFSPLGGRLIEVPRKGEELGMFLLEHEFDIALLYTQSLQKENQPKPQGGVDLRPDVIVLQRGPVATVFPRAMLGIPQVANLTVRPDDSLITMDVVQNSLNGKNEKGEHNILSNNLSEPHSQQYTMIGLTKQPGENHSKGGEFDVKAIAEKYSKDFRGDASAVIVIHRRYRSQMIRILLPNPKSGRFSKPQDPEPGASEAEKKAIQVAQKQWDESWEKHYVDFGYVVIREGDIVEFTSLELLDLTSPLNALLMTR
ncbi:hypothetical protein [Gimesia sp.]|uniref:hypothetical protein n=1 Tax=Gimesia sp. TaxID=2024833 RepID=UPI0032EF546A